MRGPGCNVPRRGYPHLHGLNGHGQVPQKSIENVRYTRKEQSGLQGDRPLPSEGDDERDERSCVAECAGYLTEGQLGMKAKNIGVQGLQAHFTESPALPQHIAIVHGAQKGGACV